jgi:hypothetical protein
MLVSSSLKHVFKHDSNFFLALNTYTCSTYQMGHEVLETATSSSFAIILETVFNGATNIRAEERLDFRATHT